MWQKLTSVNPALNGSAQGRSSEVGGEGGVSTPAAARFGEQPTAFTLMGPPQRMSTILTCAPGPEVLYNGWERRLEWAAGVSTLPNAVRITTTTTFRFRDHGGDTGADGQPALLMQTCEPLKAWRGSDAAAQGDRSFREIGGSFTQLEMGAGDRMNAVAGSDGADTA